MFIKITRAIQFNHWIVRFYQVIVLKKFLCIEIYCFVKHGLNFTVQQISCLVLTLLEYEFDVHHHYNQRYSSHMQYYVLIHIVYACHIIEFPLSNLYVFEFFFNSSVIIKPHAILFAHNIVYSCHIIKFPLLSNLSLSFFLFKCDKKQYSGTNSTYTRHLYLICSLFQ